MPLLTRRVVLNLLLFEMSPFVEIELSWARLVLWARAARLGLTRTVV